jgi:hypothetical protein
LLDILAGEVYNNKMTLAEKIKKYTKPGQEHEIDGLIIKGMVVKLIDAILDAGYIPFITSGFDATGEGHLPGSTHYKGLAIDYVVLTKKGEVLSCSSLQESFAVKLGFWTQDEFANPSSASTGGHIHADWRG